MNLKIICIRNNTNYMFKKLTEVNSLNITYTTYEDAYHFIFEFNSNLEVLFVIKDIRFFTFITEILDTDNKYRDIIYKEDINNLEISCTSDFFMKRGFNIKYQDNKISFIVNQVLLNELQNFHNNFAFQPEPIIIDNKIKEELVNYINFDEQK